MKSFGKKQVRPAKMMTSWCLCFCGCLHSHVLTKEKHGRAGIPPCRQLLRHKFRSGRNCNCRAAMQLCAMVAGGDLAEGEVYRPPSFLQRAQAITVVLPLVLHTPACYRYDYDDQDDDDFFPYRLVLPLPWRRRSSEISFSCSRSCLMYRYSRSRGSSGGGGRRIIRI